MYLSSTHVVKQKGLVAWMLFGGGACLQVNRNGNGRLVLVNLQRCRIYDSRLDLLVW